jgi:hypothetical protein
VLLALIATIDTIVERAEEMNALFASQKKLSWLKELH